MKIYTRTGDDGTTLLFAGGRVPKHHLRVEAYGTVDELNSTIGWARAQRPSAQGETWLEQIQHELFVLGADLATPNDAKSQHITRMPADGAAWLEGAIDQMDALLPPLTAFILPGGAPVGAALHMARTVCRRAERLIAALALAEPVGTGVQPYINRLSDFLFVLARWENQQAGAEETKWGGWTF